MPVIEALATALVTGDKAVAQIRQPVWPQGWANASAKECNDILTRERIGWEPDDGRTVEIRSKDRRWR